MWPYHQYLPHQDHHDRDDFYLIILIFLIKVTMIVMEKVMSVEEHASVRRREALAAEAAEVSHHHQCPSPSPG